MSKVRRGTHGPGRPTSRSVGLLGGPTAPSFVQQAVLGLLVLTQLGLAYLEWSELVLTVINDKF